VIANSLDRNHRNHRNHRTGNHHSCRTIRTTVITDTTGSDINHGGERRAAGAGAAAAAAAETCPWFIKTVASSSIALNEDATVFM
jgi:hypothetical protein